MSAVAAVEAAVKGGSVLMTLIADLSRSVPFRYAVWWAPSRSPPWWRVVVVEPAGKPGPRTGARRPTLHAGASVVLSAGSAVVQQGTDPTSWLMAATVPEGAPEALSAVTFTMAVLVRAAPRSALPSE